MHSHITGAVQKGRLFFFVHLEKNSYLCISKKQKPMQNVSTHNYLISTPPPSNTLHI